MAYEIPESFSQRGDRAQETENRRITAIADELRRLCRVYETQSGTGKADVTTNDAEQRAADNGQKPTDCGFL